MRLLASRLREQGWKVNTTFIKSGHLMANMFQVLLVRLSTRQKGSKPQMRVLTEKSTFLFRKMFRIWLVFDVVSICLKFAFCVYLPVRNGYVVIVEEYIPATISDYIYLNRILGRNHEQLLPILNILQRLLYLGGPMEVFFLDASLDKLRLRWNARGTHEEKPEYLGMQRTLLLTLLRKLSSDRICILDTGRQAIEETHKLVVGELNEMLSLDQKSVRK